MFDVIGHNKLWLVKEINNMTQCSFKFDLHSSESKFRNAREYFQFSHQDFDEFAVVPIPQRNE